MANYKKSFNFRSGVQVDTDNFVVNANGLVGIGTSVPRRVLDVYGTIRTSGLVTSKNLYATGISTFDSDVDLNNGTLLIGDNITLDANSGVITATAINIGERTVTNLVGYSTEAWIIDPVISGIYTSFNVAINGVANSKYGLLVGNDPESNSGIGFDQFGNTITSGIITSNGGFSGELSATDLTGIIPNDRFAGIITATLQGNVIGIATTARGLTGTPDIVVGVATATRIVSTSSSVGFATVSDTFYANKIGIGTELPTEALEIRKDAGNARVEILSLDGSTSRIGIGQSSNVSSGSSIGLISYGGNPGALTFKNQGVGDVNMHLHTGPAGVETGGYNWYHKANTNLMKLSYQGNLGINETNPTHRLHVGGGATFTSTAYFENVNVKTNFTSSDASNIKGTLTVDAQTTFSNTISYGATVSYNSNTGAEFRVPSMTQDEVTGLSTAMGSILYNSDMNLFVGYANTGWQHLSIQA